jgi:hypothetical protein
LNIIVYKAPLPGILLVCTVLLLIITGSCGNIGGGGGVILMGALEVLSPVFESDISLPLYITDTCVVFAIVPHAN